MDPHASHNVGHAVLISTVLGAAYGASYGLIQRTTPGLFAFTTGTSVCLTTSIFFGVREWAVSPLLVATIPGGQYEHRRKQLQGPHVDGPDPSGGWTEMRLYKVPDSGLAGALTGGVLNTLRRGRAGILPGAFTLGLTAALIQLGVNEASIARIKLVARELQSSSSLSPSTTASSSAAAAAAAQERPRDFSEWVLHYLSYVMPIKRLTDEEYVRVSEKKRAEIDRKLESIRRELEGIEAADAGQLPPPPAPPVHSQTQSSRS